MLYVVTIMRDTGGFGATMTEASSEEHAEEKVAEIYGPGIYNAWRFVTKSWEISE